ncbi:CaiB/BaiF CoA transferase family protein [Ramlibacter sp. Leaf400]|uniref:CaiB/BaiF CoA transferase family protein n=1 Tax=Ramlibacter sp. Leaf400 TaxID=1736365 RepID=UPI0006F6AE9D|nr:CaiB/BaiF CoA-transferase family protein [Ramlibacter sp. Leaf400]KQT09719.1 carnitine dehydratase [Ramlibacter sp. Leaf400]
MAGPLQGLKVVEMAGLGPGPFCGMLLADLGADVVRIDRPPSGAARPEAARFDVTSRGKRSLAIDLRKEGAAEAVLQLVAGADILIEGFRPGVMERLGLGPDACLQRNPRLVFGRMTGWGQQGPLSASAGHDINYLALTGVLHATGRADSPPAPPLNIGADYGGGAMFLAFGLLAALQERQRSGKGQVVDAAMTDGAALLAAIFHGLKAAGQWSNTRAANLLDGGAHFYDCYECADGKFVSIGAIEPQFYALLRERCGLEAPEFDAQMDAKRWPQLKEKLAAFFRTRTRDAWCALLEGSDACFAPVLDWDEAPHHPHNRARGTFIEVDGVTQPAPAPRFERTPAEQPRAPRPAGADGEAVLREWEVDPRLVEQLRARQAI